MPKSKAALKKVLKSKAQKPGAKPAPKGRKAGKKPALPVDDVWKLEEKMKLRGGRGFEFKIRPDRPQEYTPEQQFDRLERMRVADEAKLQTAPGAAERERLETRINLVASRQKALAAKMKLTSLKLSGETPNALGEKPKGPAEKPEGGWRRAGYRKPPLGRAELLENLARKEGRILEINQELEAIRARGHPEGPARTRALTLERDGLRKELSEGGKAVHLPFLAGQSGMLEMWSKGHRAKRRRGQRGI